MADTDPVTSPDTDPAYAQGDQDAEATMTAPSGPRPDAATHPTVGRVRGQARRGGRLLRGARYADRGRWVDAHSARARSTAGTPITRPPTTAEPGRSKNTTCASTEDP